MRKAVLVVNLVLGGLASGAARAAIVDPAFSEMFVAKGAPDITSIESAPDGSHRLLFLSRSGEIRIIESGVILPTPCAAVMPPQTAAGAMCRSSTRVASA